MATAPNNRTVWAGCADGTVRIWDCTQQPISVQLDFNAFPKADKVCYFIL